MKPSTWLAIFGLAVFMFLANSFLSFSSAWIKQIEPMPVYLSRLFYLQAKTFIGNPRARAWWILLGYLLYLVVNVLGEELWWHVSTASSPSHPPRLTRAVGQLVAIEYFRHANQKDYLLTYPFDQSKTLRKMGKSLLVFYYNKSVTLN